MINLFKQKNGFNYSTFTGLIKNQVEEIPEELEDMLLKVENSTYQDLINHKIMWKDGELVPNSDYQNYISELKKQKQEKQYLEELSIIKQWFLDNDWKPNKIICGEWEQDDPRWLEYKQERAIKRVRQDELNKLLNTQ